MTDNELARMARSSGVSVEEARRRYYDGTRYCTACKVWHLTNHFKVDPKTRMLHRQCERARRRVRVANPYTTKDPKQAPRFKPWGGRKLVATPAEVAAEVNR